MTKPVTRNVCLPRFPGFYESCLSDAIDREEESWIEYRCDGGDSGPDYESDYPEALQLATGPGNIGEMFFDHTNHDAAYRSLAFAWSDAFDYHAGEVLGMSRPYKRRQWTADGFVKVAWDRPTIGARFESMESPREYNFTTDSVFADIPLKSLRAIFKRSADDGHESLSRIIRARFTSRSGFISFYSNDVADWLAKPLRDWDHNELGTLLLSGLDAAGADIESREYDSGFFGEVFESAVENEGAYSAWESAVDWPAFDKARAMARVEKLADWLQDDGAAARAWVADNPGHVALMRRHAPGDLAEVLGETARCPDTRDMFQEAAR